MSSVNDPSTLFDASLMTRPAALRGGFFLARRRVARRRLFRRARMDPGCRAVVGDTALAVQHGLAAGTGASPPRRTPARRTPPSTVAVIHAAITPVPMACCSSRRRRWRWPAATTPKMKASEVITIGRKRRVAASMAAFTTEVPGFQRSRANSTIRIAFLAERPMIVIRRS